MTAVDVVEVASSQTFAPLVVEIPSEPEAPPVKLITDVVQHRILLFSSLTQQLYVELSTPLHKLFRELPVFRALVSNAIISDSAVVTLVVRAVTMREKEIAFYGFKSGNFAQRGKLINFLNITVYLFQRYKGH